MRLGRFRVDFERNRERRFAVRSGGQATAGPWRELVIPWVGSFIFSRAQPLPPTDSEGQADGDTSRDGDEERGV